MKEFSGEAGTIYLEQRPKRSEDDKPYEVWFEDFFILGNGDTEIEALKDARQHAADIKQLVEQALAETITPATTAKDDNYQEQVGAVTGGD